ncbi:MAG: InlB B-repeat-containing protein [Paludibacteraceae bacterium]|nr:InlB B-repeat-containing protein [Paludibacteraceae bacterium]
MNQSTSFAQMANNQSISLSSALRANTPPTKGQTTSRKFPTLSIFLLLSFFCTTNAWGAEELVYTLTPANGSNNSYAGNCDITISGIKWNLTGNSQEQPWRIGGKSLTKVDRAVYSKTAMPYNISKIEITHGTASSITVNSFKLIISDAANDSGTEIPVTFKANATTTIELPAGDYTNKYFKFLYNVTVSGSSNKYLQFTNAKFYAETAPAVTYEVTWKVDGETYTEGSPSTSVSGGSKVTQLPTNPDDCSADVVFVGWTESTTFNGTKPSDLFSDVEGSPVINKRTTFYAVFAKREGEQKETTTTATISGSTSGSVKDVLSWSSEQQASANAPTWNTNDSEYRFYYNSGGNGCSMTIDAEEGVTITGIKITASSTSYRPTVKYNVDGGSDQTGSWSSTTMAITELSAASFKFRNANTANTQLRFKNVVVTYSMLSGEYTYSDYTTSCTTQTTYTVTFNANGHGTKPDDQTIASGQKAIEPTAPTATGYAFGGWYTDQACSDDKKFDFNTPITDNIPLYAKWTAKTYTITLDANGGTFVDNRDSQTKGSATFDYIYGTYANYNDAPNLTEYYSDLKRDGYQFDKWVSAGSPWNKLFTSTGDRTIQAQWSKLYSITLSENGTTTELTPQTSTSYTLPTELTAGGSCQDDTKELVGWSTVAIPNPGDKPTSHFYELGETVTLTADQTTFYAVFATPGEGGGGAPEETTLTIPYQTLTTGLSNSYSTKNFTYGGFTFEINACVQSNYCQMRDNATLSYIYIPELPGAITKIATSDCKNASGSSYTGTLRLKTTKTRGNSETDDIEAITYSSVNSFSWSLSNETYKTGYLFTSAGLRIKDLSITYTTSGGTSYSEYVTTCVQVTKYNVNYNIGDGATGAAPTETSKAEGTIFTLASADGISKEGYSFAGWLCDKDGNIYGASEEYTMPAANVTFTAQWNELPKYTVTFYNKGKKHSEVAQTIANAPIECPTGLVACDGYSFAGWSTKQLDGVSTFTKIGDEYTPESDITLYAVYAEGNATTNGWVKVTDLSTITEGIYALLSNNNYAFNGTINNNSDGEHTTNSFVFNGEGVASEAPSGTCEIELIASGDGFKMYSEGKGYLYAKAAKSGNLAWQQNENSSWSWDSTKDNWVYAEKNAFLRSYNNTFRTYGTNNGNAIYFAKKNVTSFTTSPACDPMITIGSPEPVMVTSANGIRVDAVQNITISATNLDQNADAAQVSIKLVSDNSAFKFKEVGANGDGQATSTWAGIANATFDKTLCVTYTPTEAGQEETATLTVTAYRHNGSTEYATATMQVRGRSLPEQFVLVANTGDGWVALPNTLGTGSTASIPYPIAVEVDNDDDPTSIPLAPSTTIYKAAARSTVNAIPTGLRFTTETGGYMQASTTETNIWLASNNSENMQSWTLNSTDFVDYSIRVNNAAEGHNLNYSNTQKKIGNYKSDNKLRILPIEDICVQHAAPENIDVVSVSANAATIQWDAVATATLGYEYRIGATGEWTKVGNVTELELTLSSLTNYTVYVRASVEGTNTNCSYEAEAEFTTLNCDDVPYDIHYASGANSVTVYWTCEAATSTISLYHDKEGLSLVETKTSVTSPCQFTSLDKFTTYYVQIQAGGSCPSGMIQVRTEQLDLDVVEWMSDGVVVDVNTDETITVTLENEVQYGSGVGQVAEELFFSKYFEGSGNLKLLAIYNGTGKDVDLSTYRIDRGSNGNATKIGKIYNLSQLGTIKNGQEIIFYSKPNVSEYPYSCSQSFLASKVGESGIDANPRWILCDAKEHNGVNFEAMDFNGDDPLLLYKGNTLIDVFGVSTAAEQPSKKTQCSGRTENSWSADDVANMDYGKTEADFEGGIVPDGVDLLNPTITAYTARVIMFRKNTVLSGSNAVAKNITDFVTLASEWEVRTVCKDGDDGNLTCGAYQELGKFNYADYYTKYETMAGEQVFDENARRDDGTIKIRIPNLSTYSCMNIKFNIKVGGVTVNEVTKVPILIADEQSTNGGDVFANLKTTLGTKIVNGSEVTIQPLDDEQLLEKCEVCDIVVLANGKLTHEADGINQFNDLTIYPEGTFNNTSDFTVNRLLVHAKLDEVGCAIVENNGVTLTTNAIAHTKRIDAKYWYPFSLPYNCNIADIKQASGESMGTYGVHWGIQYYDGQRRQASGTSAGIGQSSNFWTPMGENDQLNAYQGYVIALFDDAVEKETDMRTIYFPPVVEQMYTESGTDSKETTITSWNVNLEAEKRHHGWNFTGSPYISVFNPQATGLSEDCGLFSEVLIVSGHYDQGSNEYLYDDEYVYVSIPSPNGAKYYDQNITSATSLKPFTAYFVQAIDPTSGNDETQTLAYAKAGRELPTSAPRRSTSTRQRVLVELGVTAPDGQTDNTGIWVDEKYTSAYEIAADLTKMYVAGDRPQLYTMAADNEKMAYNALPDEMAGNVQLGLYAPTAGSYTLFINERVSRLKGVERVDLLYNNVVVADLLSSAYVIDVPKKGAVNGYTISVYRKANVTTAIDNISGQPINIITGDGYLTLEGIVSDAQVSVYDMLGRLVAAQNANDETNIRIPFIVQGVYNVVVKNEQGMTTIKVVLR